MHLCLPVSFRTHKKQYITNTVIYVHVCKDFLVLTASYHHSGAALLARCLDSTLIQRLQKCCCGQYHHPPWSISSHHEPMSNINHYFPSYWHLTSCPFTSINTDQPPWVPWTTKCNITSKVAAALAALCDLNDLNDWHHGRIIKCCERYDFQVRVWFSKGM